MEGGKASHHADTISELGVDDDERHGDAAICYLDVYFEDGSHEDAEPDEIAQPL